MRKKMSFQMFKPEELRRTAEQVNNSHIQAKVNTVLKELFETAKSSAALGNYSCRLYHDELANERVVSLIKEQLKALGYSKPKVAEDSDYSAHARQTMIYIEIDW